MDRNKTTTLDWRDAFVLWNNLLLESFFSQANRGEEVWLQVDGDELDGMGRELGGDEGFIKAVRAGPPWGTVVRGGAYSFGDDDDIVARAKGLVLQRGDRHRRPSGYCDPGEFAGEYAGVDAPTYLPYLAILVRTAAVTEAGFYAELRKTLGLPNSWGTQNLIAMEPVWADLQRWTHSTGGRFGRFVFRSLGSHSRVGVPRSQSVVSRKDRALLPRLFDQAGARAGQQLTPSLLSAMKQLIAHQHGYSTQLRDAVDRAVFSDIVEARLRAVFGDWDGSVTPAAGSSRSTDAHDSREREGIELSLSLRGDAPPWIIHWRVPAVSDGELVAIQHGTAKWHAPSLGTEATTTIDDECDEAQAAARTILARSGSEDVSFDASTSGEDATCLGELNLSKESLRTLAWHFNPLLKRYELRESPLRANDAAYLLASKANAKRFANFLEKERINHSWIASEGLPEGWKLACIPDCSRLTDDQRASLTDGRQGRSSPRTIRLVGGKAVTRGGLRQFLSYDLPSAELDAPEGAVLRAEGLKFLPEGDVERAAVRRFQIIQEVAGPKLYDIFALKDGVELDHKRLRIAGNAGEARAGGQEGHAFSVDPMGWPTRQAGGLRGQLPSQCVSGTDDASFQVQPCELGELLTAGYVEDAAQAPLALFLDALAQERSMGYGPARDLVARLQVRGGMTPDPALALLALRRRGHIEIETDRKGHMTRIFPVEPSLYGLTVRTDGGAMYGVTGTLRLQQWSSLAKCVGLDSIYRVRPATSLHEWRVFTKDPDELAERAFEAGFDIQTRAGPPIAVWAASTEEAFRAIQALASESVGSAGQDAQVLSAASATFKTITGDVRVDDKLSCQLFKMPDLDIPTLQVFVLGINGSQRQTFGFVRDSAWGRWLAIDAFGIFAKEALQIELGAPWPIPYAPDDGSLWVPARLGVPYVLERALVLCSGASPETVNLQSSVVADGLDLHETGGRLRLRAVPRVYEHMARGKWLRYRWVTHYVAETVARKLGGALAPTRNETKVGQRRKIG